MADNKFKGVKFITPRGIAIFPKLHKPDTKWKAEGQYSVKLRLDPASIDAALVAKIEALRDEKAEEVKAELTAKKQGAKVKSLKVLDVLFQPETDKDSGEETGFVLINAKMTASGVSKKDGKTWSRKPDIFDSKGKKLSKVPMIFGGSELKAAVEARAYYTPKDNQVGVSFQLNGAQIIKLVTGGERNAADYGFAEEDGYEEAPAEEGSAFNDSAENTGSTESGEQPAGGDEF